MLTEIAVGRIVAQAKSGSHDKVQCNMMYTIRLVRIASMLILMTSISVVASHAASIWKVSGGSSTVYLAGSVHFLRSGDQVPDIYDQVYSQSQRVVLEVEPHRMETSEIVALYLKEGRCADGSQIRDYLDEDTHMLLQARLSQFPHLAKSIGRMRPWMAGMTLTIQALNQLGARPEKGVDRLYYQRARQDGKSTASLESPVVHTKLLSSLTRQEQNEFLRQSLEHLDEMEPMFNVLLLAWKVGDEEVLSKWFQGQSAEEDGIMEKILFKRNQNWIPTIESYLNGSETVMVIAGVGHMVGKGSVIDLLEKRGYTIYKLN